MKDAELRREVTSILEHLQDSSVSLINSGFGFQKSVGVSQKLRSQLTIKRPVKSESEPQPLSKAAAEKLPDKKGSAAVRFPKKRATQPQLSAFAKRNTRKSFVKNLFQKTGAHLFDLTMVSGLLFASLILVFKFLNKSQSFVLTVENVVKFLVEQLDPLLGIGIVYAFCLFYYLFFFVLRAQPIGAALFSKAPQKSIP